MKTLPLNKALRFYKREMMFIFDTLDNDAFATPYGGHMFDKGGIIAIKTLPEEALIYFDAIKSILQFICETTHCLICIFYPEFHS